MTTPIHVPLQGPLVETRFVERPNRFLLRCRLPEQDGEVVDVHMADPGRLEELLIPGTRVWIRWAASATRKTDWSAVLVESPDGDGLVSVDTTMPNRLIHRALAAGALDEFDGWTLDRAEFPMGRSRIDFLLVAPGRRLALEVKSVTLVEDGVALFPDAVTARGARHVRELTKVHEEFARGDLTGLADPLLVVPSTVTARIQEMHITLGQMLCGALERELGLV